MSSEVNRTISVLTGEMQSESLFPATTKMLVKSSQLAIESVKRSLADCVESLEDIVDNLSDVDNQYDVDTITFSLSIDSSGKISLIGELSAGLVSSITITLKKKK